VATDGCGGCHRRHIRCARCRVRRLENATDRAAQPGSRPDDDSGDRIDGEATGAGDRDERDERDAGREHSPMVAAADAVEVDTTGLSIDEVVARIVALVRG